MNQRCLLLGTLALATTVGIAVSGCGGASSLLSSAIPEISDLAALDNSTLDATVGTGRAVISGNITRTVTTADRDLPEKARLKKLKLRQSLDQAVQVAIPGGGIGPASFQLRNITLAVTFSDGARTANSSSTTAGPVTFTREGSSGIYRATAPVEVSNVTYEGTTFATIREIITTAPSPNTVQARLSFDADDTQLPNGSVLRFTFVGGKAKVEL